MGAKKTLRKQSQLRSVKWRNSRGRHAGKKEHEGLHLHFAKADIQHLRWVGLALQPNPLMYWPKCWKGLSDEPSPILGQADMYENFDPTCKLCMEELQAVENWSHWKCLNVDVFR